METTDLIVKEQINALELFTGDQIDPLLEEITKKAKAFVPDLSTDSSRKEIASMARKVARSKTLLDGMGKELVSEWKTKAKKVDVSRKHIRDTLDALRDEIRLPLTEYEAEEQRKLEEQAKQAEILACHEEAIGMNDLFDREKAIAIKEAEMAKQEEERKEKEEAEEKVKQAEKEKKEAIEKAEREKQQAIEAEQLKAKEEAERVEAERIRKEREEKERAEAERIKAERKASNVAHQRKFNRESLEAFGKNGVDEDTAKKVIELIAKGLIDHITINY
jgi:hypothetical protein